MLKVALRIVELVGKMVFDMVEQKFGQLDWTTNDYLVDYLAASKMGDQTVKLTFSGLDN
jgi:hypothetical protein